MLLGYARGKVGDLVFTRIDGEQVSRPRNRHPYNPRTNKQLIQRAIMATIMAAYSAGREIFDHSFQGYSVGTGCQRRFLSLNANMLRTQLAADYENATPEEALAKVTAPKVQTPVPNQYIVSEGSLTQNLFSLPTDPAATIPQYTLPAPLENETVAAYAARNNMQAGDIYTFVIFVADRDDVLYKALGVASVSYDTVQRGSFAWVRLIVKNVTDVATAITLQTPLSTLFDVEASTLGNESIGVNSLADGVQPIDVIKGYESLDDYGLAFGLIKSRRDADLRSNCTLTVVNPDEFGLYWNDILTAWKAGTVEIGSSDLILEGGDE